MNDLFIQNKGNKSPTIDFKVSGELLIEGMSVSEDPIEFYKPVLDWIDDLKANLPRIIILKLKLEFFNTGTSKILLYIFNILERMFKSGTEVKIIWCYGSSNDDMLQAGMDYESIVNVPFKLVEI